MKIQRKYDENTMKYKDWKNYENTMKNNEDTKEIEIQWTMEYNGNTMEIRWKSHENTMTENTMKNTMKNNEDQWNGNTIVDKLFINKMECLFPVIVLECFGITSCSKLGHSQVSEFLCCRGLPWLAWIPPETSENKKNLTQDPTKTEPEKKNQQNTKMAPGLETVN